MGGEAWMLELTTETGFPLYQQWGSSEQHHALYCIMIIIDGIRCHFNVSPENHWGVYTALLPLLTTEQVPRGKEGFKDINKLQRR